MLSILVLLVNVQKCSLNCSGINGVILTSSVESMERYVLVCPNTTVTFTCSDTQVLGTRWFALPLLNEDNSPNLSPGTSIGVPFVVEDIFIITVVEVENRMGIYADITSTLSMTVNDMIQDGTSVTCKTPNVTSLIIQKQGILTHSVMCSDTQHLLAGPPMPPSITTSTQDYGTETFKILVSWDDQKADYYILSFNISSLNTVNTSMTTFVLIGEYNSPLQITLLAVKCAWISEAATSNVSEGTLILCVQNLKSYKPSAGCSPPTPPVNGSIDDWTSSMIGAQVTYSCDRDLVIVGETVATCSPSLQWIPSSNDIMCIQPPQGISI